MEKYVMVMFPEIQYFMDEEDYRERVFLGTSIDADNNSSIYFVPEDMYERVMKVMVKS